MPPSLARSGTANYGKDMTILTYTMHSDCARDGAKGDRGLQGKTGPQGPPGDKGPTRVKGEEGAKVEPGTQGTAKQNWEPGPMPFNNWKECAWKDLFDGKDSGLIKVINTGHTHVFRRELFELT